MTSVRCRFSRPGFLGAGLVVCLAIAAGPLLAQEPPAKPADTSYKVGIINRAAVIKGYKKTQDEYAHLQAEVDARQKQVEALGQKIQEARQAYDAVKDTLSEEQRIDQEGAIQREMRNIPIESKRLQSEIDELELKVVKKISIDVDEMIALIGREEDFHLILDGDLDKGVLYYSPTMNLTQRVIDRLNSAYDTKEQARGKTP